MRDEATIRIYRPWDPRGGVVTVLIDGVKAGQLRSRQATWFDLPPGNHQVRLRHQFILRSDNLVVSLAAGEVRDYACDIDFFGEPDLRLATAKESARIASFTSQPPDLPSWVRRVRDSG